MVQSHSPSRSFVSIPPAAHRDLVDRMGAYIRLTKPRVVELLLVTTVPAMVLAAGGWPSTRLVVAVVVGGALAAGGANTINACLPRPAPIELAPRRTWDHSGNRLGSTVKSRKELGFEAKVGLAEGIRRTVRWTQSNRPMIENSIRRHRRRLEEAAGAR